MNRSVSLLHFPPTLEGWCTGSINTTSANGVAGWPNCLKRQSIIAQRSHPLNAQTAISHHGTFTYLNATRSCNVSFVVLRKSCWIHLCGCCWNVFVCLLLPFLFFSFLVTHLSLCDPSSFSPIPDLGKAAKALLGYHSYHLPSLLTICASIWII